MKEKTLFDNKTYSIKMLENPDINTFSNNWKELQKKYPPFMTFESIHSYVKNIRNLGNIIIFTLEKNEDTKNKIKAIFALQEKKILFYKKYKLLMPKMGFDYKPLFDKKHKNMEEKFFIVIIDELLKKPSTIYLEPLSKEFANKIKIRNNIERNYPESLHVLSLPKSLEGLLNKFSKKFRKNIKYYQNKVRKDFSIEFEDSKLNIQNYENFIEIHKKLIEGRKKLTPFQYDHFKKFLFDMLYPMTNSGIFSLKLNKKIAGMIIYVDWNNTRHFLNIGTLSEYKKYSLSRLLIFHTIKDAINKKLEYFSFGQGNDPYKSDWNCKERHNKSIIIYSNKTIRLTDSLLNNIYEIIKNITKINIMRVPKKIFMTSYILRDKK